jgi:hypothetical protein
MEKSRMSEQTGISLSDIISKLEGARINELWKVVNNLRSLSTEINSFLEKKRSGFTIIYDNDLLLEIYGRYSGCLYYSTSPVSEQKTLADIYSKFFDDVKTFYMSVLKCLAEEIDDFVNTVEDHLPQDDEDDP